MTLAKIVNWWQTKITPKFTSTEDIVDEYLTVPSDSFICTVDKLWDASNFDHDLYDQISKEDLDKRVYFIADKLIDKLQFDLDICLNENEFRWFINGHSRVRATFRGRIFLHDEFSVDNTWSEIKQ